jgi:hypothetical protein
MVLATVGREAKPTLETARPFLSLALQDTNVNRRQTIDLYLHPGRDWARQPRSFLEWVVVILANERQIWGFSCGSPVPSKARVAGS